MDVSVSEAGLGKKLRRLSQAGRRLLQVGCWVGKQAYVRD